MQTLEELQTFTSRVTTAQRKKRHLAEHLPDTPGVYLFRDSQETVLYVGTSKHLRTRVRSYFTASETRSRMGEMVNLAHRVEGIECATPLEASIRELRLIAEHKPKFNRRSRHPERAHWVKLTVEPWPRLALVRRVLDDGAVYLGPYASKAQAEQAVAALHETFPIRQCNGRLPKLPTLTPCALAEMKRCLSPCDQTVSATAYADLVDQVRTGLVRSPQSCADHPAGSDGDTSPTRSATRRPPGCATVSAPSSVGQPAPSASPRSPAAPRWSPPGRRTAAGPCTSSATAGSPEPA